MKTSGHVHQRFKSIRTTNWRDLPNLNSTGHITRALQRLLFQNDIDLRAYYERHLVEPRRIVTAAGTFGYGGVLHSTTVLVLPDRQQPSPADLIVDGSYKQHLPVSVRSEFPNVGFMSRFRMIELMTMHATTSPLHREVYDVSSYDADLSRRYAQKWKLYARGETPDPVALSLPLGT